MTQRLFLVCPARPGKNGGPGIRRMAWEVMHYDRPRNRITLKWPDGRILADDVFYIDMAKRVGYSLTAEIPPEFKNA